MAKTELPAFQPRAASLGVAKPKGARSHSWRWLFWMAGIGILATAAYALWSRSSQAPEVVVAPASVQGIASSFTAEGVVKGTDYSLGSELGGRVDSLRYREGQSVEEGAVILTVSAADSRASQDEAMAAYSGALASVRHAEVQSAAVSSRVRSQIAAAAAGLAEARRGLDRARAVARPQEISQAEHRVARAQAALDSAGKAFDRAKFLFDEGAIPKAQLEKAELDRSLASAEFKDAQDALTLMRAGARTEDVAIAVAAVQTAKAQYDVARSGLGELAASEEAVRVARSGVNRAQAAVDLARASLAKTEVRAPHRGVITKLSAEKGSILVPGVPALVISTRERLRIEAEISSEDAGKVVRGMELSVTSAAYPGRIFRAKVTSMLPVGELKPDAAIRTRIIRTTLDLLSGWEDLRPGMEVDVEGSRVMRRSLCVPNDALIVDGSSTAVIVVVDGVAEKRTVKTGYSNADVTEILEGLRLGDRVVIEGKDAIPRGGPVTVRG